MLSEIELRTFEELDDVGQALFWIKQMRARTVPPSGIAQVHRWIQNEHNLAIFARIMKMAQAAQQEEELRTKRWNLAFAAGCLVLGIIVGVAVAWECTHRGSLDGKVPIAIASDHHARSSLPMPNE